MRSIRLAGALVALSVAAAPLAAQTASTPSLHVAPYAGYMLFGNVVDGPLGTSVKNAPSAIVGAQVGIDVTRGVSLYGNLAHSSTDLQVGVPFLKPLDVGQTTAWLYDGGVQFGVPLARRGLSPFVQLGAGAIHYKVSSGPVETTATNVAFNGGVGADLRLTDGIGLRLLAKDYVGRFDVREATGISYEPDFSHNFALSAGIKLEF